jgi:translation elongation factor EF-4
VSAKTGLNVSQLLDEIVDRIPSPSIESPNLDDQPVKADTLRALLFDSWYDDYKGVVCLVLLKNGNLARGDLIVSYQTKTK